MALLHSLRGLTTDITVAYTASNMSGCVG
jgi:hypothetical protein